MSTIKRGQITASTQWAKHLRRYWKRKFWKGERAAVRAVARAIERRVSRERDAE